MNYLAPRKIYLKNHWSLLSAMTRNATRGERRPGDNGRMLKSLTRDFRRQGEK